MLTAIVYFFNGLVLGYFAWKVFRSIRKKKNPFLFYFFGVSFFFSLSLFVYTVLITLSITFSMENLLFWADFFGRMLLYVGSVFAIQTPLYKFFPKSKSRFWASAFVGFFGLLMVVYNLFDRNAPYIDKLGIIHWQASNSLGLGLAIVILGIWLPTSIVFLTEFFKSKFNSRKSFLLGFGFLTGSVSGAMQDFGSTTFEYTIINLLLAVGFVLILIGLFYDET